MTFYKTLNPAQDSGPKLKLKIIGEIIENGSTFKCSNALAFDFF